MAIFYLLEVWLREDLVYEVVPVDKEDSNAGQCQEGLVLPRRGRSMV